MYFPTSSSESSETVFGLEEEDVDEVLLVLRVDLLPDEEVERLLRVE